MILFPELDSRPAGISDRIFFAEKRLLFCRLIDLRGSSVPVQLMMRLSKWLRALSILNLISVLMACSPLIQSEDRPLTTLQYSREGLLPDVGEELEHVLISVNSARRALLRNAHLISNIVNALPADTSVDIITNDRSAFVVANNPWPERIQFLEVPSTNPLTIWTQDPFLVLKEGKETILLVPREFERADDRLMAETLARERGYILRNSELFFEGGNIVSDESFIFIGANTIHFNAFRLEISEIEVVLRFQKELGRDVLVIGPAPQPIGHIDMMLTPLGNGRIAVADSAAGAEVLRRLESEAPQDIAEFEQYCEQHFFGHPSISSIRGKDGQIISAPDLRGETERMIARSQEIAQVLDGIAAALEQYGYEIVRIPFLFGGPERLPEDDTQAVQADYPMLTYNNVLLETTAGSANVYLPLYGLDALDAEAESAWRKAGFNPQPVEGLAISAMYGGALRCSVKVLERTA